MDNIEKDIEKKFGGRLRIRVNGLLVEDEKILMVRHQMAKNRSFWNLPGGGMHYGSDAIENLKREFLEEAGLDIKVGDFLFVHEFLEPPLHAIELYFEVSKENGILTVGNDPELDPDRQIIKEMVYLSLKEIHSIKNEEKHRLFWELNSINEIRIWKGYFNFENNCIK
jgi:ADP-ribose pyrophosphatase YjhB (NUDIX family)